QADVLVGTQLLSKGHHFPGVTLVAVVDGDSRLFGVDFRSHERFAQQLIQVAGRAGRADEPGTVVIQTHHPAHPLLQVLVGQGYGAFAALALKERAEARLPPYQAMALIRAESERPEKARAFLDEARAMALDLIANEAELLGPVPAPMERLAGRYRWQLVLQTRHRGRLQRLLDEWLPGIRRLRTGRVLRWSIDVDPQETL
nr:primosomal protein N' [Gammaproteobacteria bacterium]